MTAITSLDPFSQLKQFQTAAGAFISDLFHKSSDDFERVEIQKRDDAGNIRSFYIKDWDTGESRYTTVLSYVRDIKTGNIYLNEEMYIVACKCGLIFLATPFYALGTLAWYLIKTPLEIGGIALRTLKRAGDHLLYCKAYEASKELFDGFSQIPGNLGRGIFEIVKTPLFALGVELSALYGIFKPYHGRKIEALFENAWRSGASYKEDYRNIPLREGEGECEKFITDVQMKKPFYLAHCFQVRGNTSNPKIEVIARHRL